MLGNYKPRKDNGTKLDKKVEIDYSNEENDDEIFQSIIYMTEALYEGFGDFSLDDTEIALEFMAQKITYLRDLKESFYFEYETHRFSDIAKYLDEMTIGEYDYNFIENFSSKISITLDLLIVTHQKLKFYLDYLSPEALIRDEIDEDSKIK